MQQEKRLGYVKLGLILHQKQKYKKKWKQASEKAKNYYF